jgi:L-threonylcarbamoyladenylate synthase
MEIIEISQRDFKRTLKMLVKFIREGKVLVFPTDTVYGLICDAMNKKAVKMLFKIKKRQKGKPVPIFVKDIKMAKKLAIIHKSQERFLKKIWPGKVTVVLKAKNKKFPQGIIYKNKIGIRIPNYTLLNDLLKQIKAPLAQTSANISGRPTPAIIKGILKQFQNKKYQPDLIVDAGKLSKKPSVVLDLTQDPPKILRC